MFHVLPGQFQGDDEVFLVDFPQESMGVLVGEHGQIVKVDLGGGGQALPVAEAVLAAEHVLRLLQGHVFDGIAVGEPAETGAGTVGSGRVAGGELLVELFGLALEVMQAGTGGKDRCRNGSPLSSNARRPRSDGQKEGDVGYCAGEVAYGLPADRRRPHAPSRECRKPGGEMEVPE